MKEDILEQIVDGWFLRQTSTFTKHNVKYKPQKSDTTHLDTKGRSRFNVSSDIDILAIHLSNTKENKVSVVSCKSWQSGFNIDTWFKLLTNEKKRNENSDWKRFRELVEPTWAKAFRQEVHRQTLSHDFTYYIAATKITKDKHIDDFKNHPLFLNNLSDNGKHKIKIDFLEFESILEQIFDEKRNTTLEPTEIGRFIQLIKAAGLKLVKNKD